MWHEARKIEKKIRGIMIDYRKRAERRTAYYQKMREDPHQLLRIHGNKCKLYIDSRPDRPIEDSQLVPWQGDPHVLIDRFDARSQLDYLPDELPKTDESPEIDSEKPVNYERYRTLVQVEATGVAEEAYLKQLAIEEWYGKKQAEKARAEKEELSKQRASIGYKYEDSSVLSDDSDNSDSEFSDIDISVDVGEITQEQRKSLDKLATYFGIADNYYCRQLLNEKKESEYAKQLEEEEEERSKLSGRRGKRARRSLREKQKAIRTTSPPSYAMRESPTYDPYSPPRRARSHSSSSRSPSPEHHGRIEYITEFGGTSNSPDKPKTSCSREDKGRSNDVKSHERPGSHPSGSRHTGSDRHSYRSTSRERSSRHRRSEERRQSSRPCHSSTHRRARSRSRSTHRRSRSRSSRRSRSRSRDRSRSKTKAIDERYRHRRNSSNERHRQRQHSRRRSHSSSRSFSRSRSRSKSRSRSRTRSRSRSPRAKTTSSFVTKKFESQSGKTPSAVKSGDKPKLTPQERLKLRMQKQLSKQIKHDKQTEKKKIDEKEKERMNRENDIYEIQRKRRFRGRADYYYKGRSRTPSPPRSKRMDDDYRARSSSKSPRTKAYEEIGWQEY